MTTPDALDFLVDRSDLRRTRVVPGRHTADTPLEPGQVLVRIDRFALTANNVTYGAVGELIGYWRFFPAPDGWGRIPVWGFAHVARSRHEDVSAGERLFGYFPMSTHLVLQADRVSAGSFIDASSHRSALPPIYNHYTRVAADPEYDASREAETAIFRPLFTTAFLLDQFLATEAFFGARNVLVASASSKTALGLAFLLSQTRRERCTVTALTSRANATFVRGTGYYDTVVAYDDLSSLSSGTPALLVDFAGNAEVLRAVHGRLGDHLRYSCQVGVTHWERLGSGVDLPGPASVLFFAPDHMRDRLAEWGPAEYGRRVGGAMRLFLASVASWLRIIEGRGPTAVETVYRATVDGRVSPAEGHVLSLR
jgi:hypothetical protein